jgi:hypothetical protein
VGVGAGAFEALLLGLVGLAEAVAQQPGEQAPAANAADLQIFGTGGAGSYLRGHPLILTHAETVSKLCLSER